MQSVKVVRHKKLKEKHDRQGALELQVTDNISNQYKGLTPDKVWTPQQENRVSEVRAYILE
jgi:hypothetical protein